MRRKRLSEEGIVQAGLEFMKRVHDRTYLMASNASWGTWQNPLGYQVGEGMSKYRKMSPYLYVETERKIFSAID